MQDECNNDPSKKAELIKEIVRSIAIIPDHITRAVYIKNCSKILQIAESILTQEVARLKRQRNTTSKTNEYHPQQKVKAPSQKELISINRTIKNGKSSVFYCVMEIKRLSFLKKVERDF